MVLFEGSWRYSALSSLGLGGFVIICHLSCGREESCVMSLRRNSTAMKKTSIRLQALKYL
jgi:hypothetical protein